MTTTKSKITIPYDRKKTDGQLAGILDRASTSVSVLKQLPPRYQNLPDCELSAHEAMLQTLEGQQTTFTHLLQELTALVKSMDTNAEDLDERNKVLLGTLNGALRGKPEATLLKQITGPVARRKPATP
jgi:hypothetical protein